MSLSFIISTGIKIYLYTDCITEINFDETYSKIYPNHKETYHKYYIYTPLLQKESFMQNRKRFQKKHYTFSRLDYRMKIFKSFFLWVRNHTSKEKNIVKHFVKPIHLDKYIYTIYTYIISII